MFPEMFKKHGAVSWTELTTTDAEAAKKFYSSLFGWTFKSMQMPEFEYNVISVGDREIGGIMKAPEKAGMPTSWWSYVTVDNVDDTAKKAVELGGKLMVGPMDIPNVGRFCIFQDPQGAAIAVITYGM